MTFRERRSYPRIPVRFRALFGKENDFIEAQVSDVSLGGLCLVSNNDIRVGQRIDVKIDLDDQDMRLEGEVAWTRKNVILGDLPPQYEIGVKFLSIDKEYMLFIDKLVKHYKERRAYYRHEAHLPVWVNGDHGAKNSIWLTANLSSAGIFIISPETPGIGSRLGLTLQLPNGEKINMEGTVMHSSSSVLSAANVYPQGFGVAISAFDGDGARKYLSYIGNLSGSIN